MDKMSVDMLIAQLAETYSRYEREQEFSAQCGHKGPLDEEMLPVPVALLRAAAAARGDGTSEELDAVRALLRQLWQLYDSGGHSMGRSVQARIVEVAMQLVGHPSVGAAALNQYELLHQCEERAYQLSLTARTPEEWQASGEAFRAAYEHRQKMMAQNIAKAAEEKSLESKNVNQEG
jgi:hypothetical protein